MSAQQRDNKGRFVGANGHARELRGASELRTMAAITSSLLSRAMLARQAGQHFGGERDLYTTMGYPREVTAEDYLATYLRQDIAGRIVDAYPDATWRVAPTIAAQEEDGGKFADAVFSLDEKLRIWARLARADRLANIGHYGVILLGFDGGEPLWSPLRARDRQLLYVKPHGEATAEISKWNTDPTSPRFGKPELYNITIGTGRTTGVTGVVGGVSQQVRAHWTRVIHIAEKALDDDSVGLPRLERVFNRLMDTDKLLGSSAEIFWNNAAGLWALKADPELEWDDRDVDALESQLTEMSHGLRRWLRLRGVEPQNIAAQVADPRNFVESLLDVVAGATGIPKRILVGSERGELSSEQDENNWAGRVAERRETHVIPNIIRPFLDTLILRGALPAPAGGRYNVEWPKSDSLGDEARARIADTRASAIQKYTMSIGAEVLVPPREFREVMLGLPPEPEAEYVSDITEPALDETDAELGSVFDEIRALPIDEETALEPIGLEPEAAATGTSSVASTALNGAQIQAIKEIAFAVALGELPTESAIALIKAGFPFIPEEVVRGIVNPLVGFEPASREQAAVAVNKAMDAAIRLIANAEPRTLYVRRDVLNWREIARWAEEQGIETTLGDNMHVTIAFSRQPIDWLKAGEAWAPGEGGKLTVQPGGPRLVELLGPNKDALVLMFSSSELCWRHEDIKRAGASWDWPDYQPHITITYDSSGVALKGIEPYRGKIELGPEIFEELDEDWRSKLTANDYSPDQPRDDDGKFGEGPGSGGGGDGDGDGGGETGEAGEPLTSYEQDTAREALNSYGDKVPVSDVFSKDVAPPDVVETLDILEERDLTPKMTVELDVADLTPTQDDIWTKQTRAYIERDKSLSHGPTYDPKAKPVVYKMDGRNYLVDGHHRVAADRFAGRTSVEVTYRVVRTPK